ncbi:hypothetical protein [Nocardia sp. NPDC050710]|uniref:hypothetical protein n=1 Tax=Nocardia sp. NPDC050710 TaxID=3157220 RepID=UPI0033DE2DE9
MPAEGPSRRDESAYWAATLLQHALCAPDQFMRAPETDLVEYVETYSWSPRDQVTPGSRAPLAALTMAIVRSRHTPDTDAPAEASIVINVPSAGNHRDPDRTAVIGGVTTFPVNLVLEGVDVDAAFRGNRYAVHSVIEEIDRQLDQVPNAGVGYQVLRNTDPVTGPILRALPEPPVSFTFHREQAPGESEWSVAARSAGTGAPVPVIGLTVTMHARAAEMTARWRFDRNVISEPDIAVLRTAWRLALSRIVF